MSYPPQYRQGAYTAQQVAQVRAQQEQQQRQRQQVKYAAAQPAAACYPSPESTSPSSSGSSPTYAQPSPVFYRPAPQPSARSPAQPQDPRRCSTTPKDKPWVCMYPEHQATVAFSRKADLMRHYEQVHNVPQLMDCPQSGCHRKGDYGFGRKDKLVDHLRDVHGVDIPKRSNGQGSRR